MDVNAVLLDILVVLVAAKLAAEIADRVGIPAVVAEIAAGVLIGPSVLDVVGPSEALHVLAELGVILLLLEVGLEMDLRDLRSVGRASLLVAIVGVVVPMVAGVATGLGFGMDGNEALFVGAALTATSVGITARVFGDLRALATVEARTVLGAAVADDVLGLVILTVVTRIVVEGSVSALGIIEVSAIAIGFVVIATWVGVRVAPPLFFAIRRYSRSSGTLVVLALAFTLLLAELAHAADLAPIIGAFVAGLALGRTNSADRIRSELAPVGHLLVPVFFLKIGIDADIGAFTDPSVLGIAGALFAVGVVGKLAAATGMFGSAGDRLLVGIGMIPRGEVGLIFATLGLRQAVFGQDVYGALILVVLATTVVTPPVLRWRLLAMRAQRRRANVAGGGTTGAHVAVDDTGRVTLIGEPLPSDALAVALAASRLCDQHALSDELLEWLDFFPTGPRRWDDNAREEFWQLLRSGGPRSWQLLINAGVLQRALPELDDAIAARPGDSFLVDPLAALDFRRLAAIRDEQLHDNGVNERVVMLASLVLDACTDSTVEPVVVARRTVQRLDLGARFEQAVAGLVNDVGLLAAASRHIDAFDEERVVQLAVHLGSAEQARALWLLTRATFDGAVWECERLDQLHDLIQQLIAHPELTGRDANYEVDRRRATAAAKTTDAAVRKRIEAAPREYVTSVPPDDLVRHALRCEPPPRGDDVDVYVDLFDSRARIELVARDRVGLVAHMTHLLADSGCSVVDAVIVTWPDGVAFSSYRARFELAPNQDRLRELMQQALRVTVAVPSTPEARLRFDDDASPWHTRCMVDAVDQPGLLAAVTSAFAVSDVNVHAARITTEGSSVADTFELTDRRGGKLDDSTKERIRVALASGAQQKSTPWLRRLRAALT
jgi:Kef-type K+ transport system membrane component KefB/glycine cleavage system regulatory protein